MCRAREDAFIRARRRIPEFPQKGIRHLELWKLQAQSLQLGDHCGSLALRENLHISRSALRSEDAEPDLCDFRTRAPESEELFEVARAVGNLRRDRAMHVDVGIHDVLQDPLIRRRLAAYVMLRRKPVDRDDNVEPLVLRPGRGDDAERACDKLGVNAACLDLRNQLIEFPVANQRVTADDRNVDWLVLIDHRQCFRDQFISTEIREFAQLRFAAKVCRVKGIAAGASQRTFFCDLD